MNIKRKFIRDARHELGMSPTDLAARLRVSEQTIYKKERPPENQGDPVWYYALKWLIHEKKENGK